MRKKIVAGLAVLVLALAGIGGWYWWDVLRFRQSTDDAYVQSDVTLISPKIEGYIKKVKVVDNQEVAEGAILFVIDDRDFKAKAAQAEAAAATTEATIATYESRLKLQQAMIDQAAAVVQSAEADLSRAQQDYKRYSTLMTSDFASRQRFEQAEADARKAEAALAKSRAAYAAEQNQLAVLQSQRREEEARLQQARANLWAGEERSRQYGDPRADFGSGRQPRRSGRPVRQTRDPAAVLGAIAARLRHREFQGDAADADAAGATRRGVGRRLPGSGVGGPDREFRSGQRRPVQSAAAGQRDRQFHQNRAACSGADCAPGERTAGRGYCAPAFP